MKLRGLLVAVLIILVGQSATASMSNQLLIGYDSQEWAVGIGAYMRELTPISFFGFQEDFVEGFIRRTVHSQEISGWLSIGRTVSAGNIQYTFLGYTGNGWVRDFDPFYESFEMSIGAYGKYSQRFGGSLFGVEGTFRIAMDLTNHFELEPFMEFRRSGTWRLSMGINSDTFFAGLGYVAEKRDFSSQIYYYAFTDWELSAETILIPDVVHFGAHWREQLLQVYVRYFF
ncbi:MAG: hypothetical protein GX020_04010 [Firmicutes bacterium]|nr:hypothetical protein [Bacillota bacterium]